MQTSCERVAQIQAASSLALVQLARRRRVDERNIAQTVLLLLPLWPPQPQPRELNRASEPVREITSLVRLDERCNGRPSEPLVLLRSLAAPNLKRVRSGRKAFVLSQSSVARDARVDRFDYLCAPLSQLCSLHSSTCSDRCDRRRALSMCLCCAAAAAACESDRCALPARACNTNDSVGALVRRDALV